MRPIQGWINLDGLGDGDNEELDFLLNRMRRELCRAGVSSSGRDDRAVEQARRAPT